MCIRDRLWGLDKGSIANQSAISLIIRATGICWNQVVCKGMAGKQRLARIASPPLHLVYLTAVALSTVRRR